MEPPELEDCALADLPGQQETITFDGGEFGAFTKKQRLEMVRLSLADIDSFNEKAVVYENMFCIYRFEHEDRDTKEILAQIAVGKITRCRVCEQTGEELFDIKFCPRKGAKAADARLNRKDTLYQNIDADFSYNLHYVSKKGRKVEDEDKNLPKKIMLAFNLEINKSDGKFSKKRRSDSPFNMSSWSLAENVITQFYST